MATGSHATSGPQKLRLQGFANRVVQVLLRVPGLSRVVGRQLLVLYVVGRKSGKRYSIPVAYMHHEGVLLIGTGFPWGKNLRTGEPIEVLYQGRRATADVEVLSEEADVVRDYAVIARGNKNFAEFNHVGFDSDGQPEPDDLHHAWAAGARVFRLKIRP